ncbi:HlyD family efflux transporter periplasmic adaptor subunit [Novosphingobium sp. FSW06-99]|uniref:HlyD family efflux transporter periplasmic adaptor subunit n=1 Tax=Novosphingobium sp. FSW06-99 TaxID=1739113 RepID=UPI0009EC1711|nr:HlyD family efflux transporter periplasmic adaptor subunit [Novosphingobium sp. FSW06-99]
MNTHTTIDPAEKLDSATLARTLGTVEPAIRGNPRARKRGLLLLGAALVLGGLGYGATQLMAAPTEETDDAYVGGDIVSITSRVDGTVVALHADNTQHVDRGQPLIELDPATEVAALQAAEAHLGEAVRAYRSQRATVDQAAAEIAQAKVDLGKAQADVSRRQSAYAQGAVSGEELSHAGDTVAATRASLTLATARKAQAQSAVEGTSVYDNPAVLAAIAAVRLAAINLAYTDLKAPMAGVVAQRTVQLGQRVAPGTPLMAVVPLDSLWIDANFRETQLADLRVGQPVAIKADIYGRAITFHGKVLGLGAGSGNAFALLPPQNASGNWIKIVQRVPVRIALDPAELRKTPLRIGLSVDVTVDTTNRSGAFVGASKAPAGGVQASVDGGPATEARIRDIIARNIGSVR